MDQEAAVNIIKGCGGLDITGNLAVVGPNGEWPLSGIFWDLEAYDSVLEIAAVRGKVSGIGYWTGADFSESKEHRLRSRRSLKSLSFDKRGKTLQIHAL